MEKHKIGNSFLLKYGSWALVTGATSGIGLSFSKMLAKQGFNLVIVARTEKTLTKLSNEWKKDFGIECKMITADLSQESSAATIIRETQSLEIGLLINNAGYALTGDFLSDSVEKQTQLMKVNSLVPMQLAHWFGQKMVERGRGGIINISSVSGTMPMPQWSVYAASKAFLKNFSEALWWELKPKGVDVLALCPGVTSTNFHKTARINPSGVSPEKVAEEGLKNIGKRPSLIVGSSNRFIASVMALLPTKAAIKSAAFAIEKMKG